MPDTGIGAALERLWRHSDDNGSARLECNPHRERGLSVADYLLDAATWRFLNPEDKRLAVTANRLFVVYWSPKGPVFYKVFAAARLQDLAFCVNSYLDREGLS